MITCNQHDFIEIACLYRYRVTLSLIDGSDITGIALDTTYDENKMHCIKIQTLSTTSLVILNNILEMKALVKNPHFTVIEFSS